LELTEINAASLKKAFLAGAASLSAKKDWINELNVFPVPDGDTGTNMTLTIMSAVQEVSELDKPGIPELCKAISSGSLRGARGNSGVILSQLLRGFTKVIRNDKAIDVAILASAFEKATETAYKAVMKPKEGTILTVARSMSERAKEIVSEKTDLTSFLQDIVDTGNETLARTPDMLPVLKQAGVVDSGGQGLMAVMQGALDSLTGKETDFSELTLNENSSAASSVNVDTSKLDTADIRFGYCTEFIINAAKPFSEEDEGNFKSYLESMGDSIVCVADEEVVKVHVHTNDPGLAIEKGLSFGSLSRIKVDNMREEHHERLIKDASRISAEQKAEEERKKAAAEHKQYGFICVSSGKGLSDIFRDIGADMVIEGGQTMNPCTDDFIKAIGSVNADTVFIFPNNKNILLAAEQAQHMCKDKNVVVIPSRNIPQGITAMINFMPDSSPEENLSSMKEEMGRIRTCEITYAVRDTSIDGIEIKKGDFMAIGDHGMLSDAKSITDAVMDALGKTAEEDSELVSLYFGDQVEEKDAEALKEKINGKFPHVEVEIHNGGQPVYYYFISVE